MNQYLLAKLKASLSELGSDMIDIEDGAFLETIGASFEFCLERFRLLIKLLTWLSVAVLKFGKSVFNSSLLTR